jgi:ubiquitin-protein ligase E3 A
LKLTEENFHKILSECKEQGSYSKLIHTLGHIFPNPELLGQSFVGPSNYFSNTSDLQFSKEQLRSMEVDLDKDKDSQDAEGSCSVDGQAAGKSQQISVNVAAVRRAFEALGALGPENYESALIHALMFLTATLELDLKVGRNQTEVNLLNVFVISFELPWLGSGDYCEKVLPGLCRACALLPINQQASLVRFWAKHCSNNLQNLVQTLQQLISFRVLCGNFNRDHAPNDDDTITACVKVSSIKNITTVF